jgi:phytanoyl-CoA hydroxylase
MQVVTSLYRESGYAVIKGLAAEAALPALKRDVLDAIEETKASPNYSSLKTREYRDFAAALHLKKDSVVGLLTSNPIAEIVEALLGPNADLRFTSSMTKTKEKNCALDWHQDAGYDKDPDHPKFSFWIALTDSRKDNGCLRIIPGSHKAGLAKHILSKSFPPDLEIETVDESKSIDLEMRAGDAVVLSPFVHHSSWPNLSGDIRVALLAGFMQPKEEYLGFELKASFTYLRKSVMHWEKIIGEKK